MAEEGPDGGLALAGTLATEMLWRMIKCRWLEPEAYADFKTLWQSVTDVLAQMGTKYRLSFA